MSVIIAKKTKKGFIMAGDSQATMGTHRVSATKIFKADGEKELFIGGVGTLRDINVVSIIPQLIDLNAMRRDNFNIDSIIRYTVPLLQKELREHGRIVVENGETLWNSSLIICYRDKGFTIGHNFEVSEITDFCAIGSPQSFAYGAHSVIKRIGDKKLKMNNYDMVKNIMQMCIEETIHVFYPILIIDTEKDSDFTIINGGIKEVELGVEE